MEKTAIINAKPLHPNLNIPERKNLLLCNKKIIGIGYIPDDDKSTIIEANGYYILFDTVYVNVKNNAAKTMASDGFSRVINANEKIIPINTSTDITSNNDAIYSVNDLSLIENLDTFLPYINSEKISHIHTENTDKDFFHRIFTALSSHLSEGTIAELIGPRLLKKLGIKPSTLSLFSSPSFTLFSLTKSPAILATFSNGSKVEYKDTL
jgi:hypothetical protein